MKDIVYLNNSREILKILIKNSITIFFVGTHTRDENTKLEESKIYGDKRSFISNNFAEDEQDKLLVYKRKLEKIKIII